MSTSATPTPEAPKRGGSQKVFPSPAPTRTRTPMTLQRRLLLAVVCLLALVCTVIGLLINAGMRQTLSIQLNEQLSFASERATTYSRSQDKDTGGSLLFAPGQASGTLNARIEAGHLYVGGVLDVKTGELNNIVADDALPLSALVVNAPPVKRELSIGDYLLVAKSDPKGSGTLITGLPLGPNTSTLASLGWMTVFISVAGLLATGLIGSMIIRRSLAPLQRVSAVASSVATAQLETGTLALDARVAEEDSIPGTESGDVGNALNALLDNVGTAFAAREESEAQMRQFVADASHELRTPLSAIRGYTELISATEHFSDDGQRSLNRVLEQSTRMSSLVENLLLLARLDEKHQVKKAAVDLGKLAGEITEDFRITATDHHWKTLIAEAPIMVNADSSALRRVITNLLANARKHTSAGNTVTVSLNRDTSANQAVLQVHDTGEGITKAFLPQVFKRFTRADTARSGADGTTGLGLPIAKAIVESHDGTITVSSAPGNTVFEIRLPLPEAHKPTSKAAATSSFKGSTKPSSQPRLTGH